MTFTDACIYFIIAILSVSYPILLQVIGRLDERYSSSLITALFQKEKSWKGFSTLLKISLSSIIIYVLVDIILKSTLPEGNYGAKIVLWGIGLIILIITTILIYYFFLFTEKILAYYTPVELIRYFQEERKTKETDEYIYFRALADILYLSIKTEEETNCETLSIYFQQQFSEILKASPNSKVLFPDAFYEIAFKTVRDSVYKNSPKLGAISNRASDGNWLLGGIKEKRIHRQTYYQLWANLTILADHGQDIQIINYWQNANDYFSTVLPKLNIERDHENLEVILNEEEYNNQEKERGIFFEFNLALGALLLYKKRYRCIRGIFEFTNSFPPRYYLLPDSFIEILDLFVRFDDPNDFRLSNERIRYWFPGVTGGINSEQAIKNMLCKYMAILFLRQYTLQSYYYGLNPLSEPQSPNTLTEKEQLYNRLDYFGRLLKQVLDDQKLLEDLGFEFLTAEWFEEANAIPPKDIIQNFKIQLKEEIENSEIIQNLHQPHVDKFLNKSKEILTKTINKISVLKNPVSISNNYDETLIKGFHQLMERAPFLEEQLSTKLNFDSFFASRLSESIISNFSKALRARITSNYLLKWESFEQAITNLALNPNDHVILNFGIKISSLIAKQGIKGVSSESWKGISIIKVTEYDFRLLSIGFLVLRKADLPEITKLPIEENEIQKFNLESLDNDLYGSVVDIGRVENLRNEISSPGTNLDKSVLLVLTFLLRLRWNKNMPIIRIVLYDKYLQQGTAEQASDVTPFDQ
ncbi:hypothetical protein [Pedobacter sp.]|jgi:hypothetical protein|uniref:hypothetical protein n=1 Tax=Pedobacter sp. TaxID=1411316 RepID=UPI002B82FA7A|nr:hypothetical protein [Pedobacter sp.]HWW40789.1 hypothetical protein [Pedobacter sp.]